MTCWNKQTIERFPYSDLQVYPREQYGPYCGGKDASSALGRANDDDNEVADEMQDEEDKELRWKDSWYLSNVAKTDGNIVLKYQPVLVWNL